MRSHVRRQAEVQQLGLAFGGELDVGRFDVAVDQPVLVRFRQGVGYLVGHVARPDQGQGPLGGYQIFEVLPRHVFHHEVMHGRHVDGRPGGLADVEGGHDVRVPQPGHGADLAGEPLQSAGSW